MSAASHPTFTKQWLWEIISSSEFIKHCFVTSTNIFNDNSNLHIIYGLVQKNRKLLIWKRFFKQSNS